MCTAEWSAVHPDKPNPSDARITPHGSVSRDSPIDGAVVNRYRPVRLRIDEPSSNELQRTS
ncbi:hypothetical protein D5S18_21145 [Nocardia panacis]|uniref:Uncharacterized protein n=1 Tax=Nocardia panacis TaxID=2340916 RepID=A0A3A4KJ17_9NOCA|nr:hypothetical protein D5S18_21145 [Nocardia panacis]